jgi:hypothetical protein
MQPVELLLGLVLPSSFFLIGVGLIAMGASSHAEFITAKCGFALAAACLCAFVFWWSYRSDYDIWKTFACGVVFAISGISLTLVLRWVDAKESLATVPVPKNAGVIVAKPDSVIFSQGRPLNRSMEIGTSGAVFNYAGPEGSPLFAIFNKYDITMEMIDGKLKVSTKVGNDKGDLLAEIIRNEWKVAPPPSTFDRNYSDDALEVRAANGRIVLQVRVLPDRVQLQGEWWDSPTVGLRLVKSNDPAHPGALIMRFGPGVPPGPPDIVPMFMYPSDLHLGEIAKP